MQLFHFFTATKTCPTHQVQCTIPTIEILLRNIRTCFSKDAEGLITQWLPALMQSDCLYSSLFFETLQPHFTL